MALTAGFMAHRTCSIVLRTCSMVHRTLFMVHGTCSVVHGTCSVVHGTCSVAVLENRLHAFTYLGFVSMEIIHSRLEF